MAAKLRYKTITLTGSLQNLSTLLGEKLFTGSMALRAGASNAGTLYWGDSGLTGSSNCGGYLAKGESFSLNLSQKMFSSDQIYLLGTNNDLAHVTFSE